MNNFLKSLIADVQVAKASAVYSIKKLEGSLLDRLTLFVMTNLMPLFVGGIVGAVCMWIAERII